MSYQWFRMWSDAVDDEKLRLLAFEDRWHFVALLCLKRSGLLDEPESDLKKQKICVKLGLDSVELETAMKRLVTVGLINEAFQPIAWKKRQFESDSSTSRVKAFRQRQRNANETFRERPQTQTQTQTQTTDSEKREEQPRKRSVDTRGSRVPIPFAISEEMRIWARAETPGLDVDKATAEFVDYWKGVSGQKGCKLDWPATWRNRMREVHSRKAPRARTQERSEWM